MPLQRRLPKRGFHNPFRVPMTTVDLGQLDTFPSGSEVTPVLLAEKGLLRGKHPRVKILGDGALTKPLIIKAHGFSAVAKEKIEACGGTVEWLGSHD
jgi:large subunit ribosomal protein L15